MDGLIEISYIESAHICDEMLTIGETEREKKNCIITAFFYQLRSISK